MTVLKVRDQQFGNATSATSHSFTVTTVTATNAVIVGTTAYGGLLTGVTLGGVSMAQAGAGNHDRGSDGSYLQVWYLANVTGGSSVALVLTSSASTTAVGNVSEYSGMGSSLTATFYGLDDFGANTASPNPGAIVGGGTTMLALWETANLLGHTPTAYPSGYTALTASTSAGWWGAYAISPASGTPTGTYISSDDWNCVAVVFDVASTSKSATETGTGTDAVAAPTAKFASPVAETGSGADALASAQASLTTPLTETSSGADAVASATAKLVSPVAETGSAADTASVAALAGIVTETASGADAATVTIITTVVSETSSGTDAFASGKGSTAVAETSSSVESAFVPGIPVSLPDTATGTDGVGAATASTSVADTATGTDAVGLVLDFTTGDTCSATDAVAIVSVTDPIVGTFTGGAVTWWRPAEWARDRFFRFFPGLQMQNTVIVYRDGTSVEGQAFPDDVLNAANVANYYLGGHIYYVTASEAVALFLAGYTVTSLAGGGPITYGDGVYGEGVYSG